MITYTKKINIANILVSTVDYDELLYQQINNLQHSFLSGILDKISNRKFDVVDIPAFKIFFCTIKKQRHVARIKHCKCNIYSSHILPYVVNTLSTADLEGLKVYYESNKKRIFNNICSDLYVSLGMCVENVNIKIDFDDDMFDRTDVFEISVDIEFEQND